MIRKLFLTCFLFIALYAEVSQDTKIKKDLLNLNLPKFYYSIQIYTFKDFSHGKRALNRVNHNKGFFLIKDGKYFAVRYGKFADKRVAKSELKKLQKMGFSDSILVKMRRERFLKKIVFSSKRKRKKVKQRINITSLIVEANNYFENGKYQKSLNSYMKLYDAGMKDEKILLNISYLLGKLAQKRAFEKFLKKNKEREYLLYAFGKGGIEAGESKATEKILLKSLNYSEEGYLELLLGYIYEQQGQLARSHYFYKKAYIKNNKNPYFIYAYARILDIMQRYKKAMKYYKMIFNLPDNDVVSLAKKRVEELRNFE